MIHRWLPIPIALVLLACGAPNGVESANDAPGTAEPGAAETDADETSPEPTGHWIAFASGRTDNGDIYAVHTASGERVKVAGSVEPEGTPRFDASRDRIVYQQFNEAEGYATLMSGGEPLFRDPNGDAPPVWSPDGQWIAYVAQRDGQEDLFVARPDGSDERRLTHDAVTDRYPAWSPDGQRLVVARRPEAGWDLFTVDVFTVDAGADPGSGVTPEPQPITTDGTYVGHPVWSPDGQSVAFDTMIDGQAEIAVVDLESGAVTRLTERAGNDLYPAWSPDGDHIAFAGEPEGSGNWDLWLVDVGTLEIRRLTTDPAFDGAPVFVSAAAAGGPSASIADP